MFYRFYCSLAVLAMLFLFGCGTGKEEEKPPLRLAAASFKDLPAWEHDQQGEAIEAFKISCARILKKNPAQSFGLLPEAGTYGDWQEPCQEALSGEIRDARAFFETWFTPWQVSAGREPEGLFTGYYEASLRGSRTRHGPYQYPLYQRPEDLVMVDLGAFREHLKGERIAGRVTGGRLTPYEDRATIEAGRLPRGDDLVLVWVDNPVDAFFLHIQGSGRVLLDDGTEMRVGYAGQNGHPYYAIGRELIKRGALEKDKVSMQSIRAWLEANPDDAIEVMNSNKSYVFFLELNGGGPLGGEGVVLTAERSLAIDRSLLPYGMPVWLAAEPPIDGVAPIRRLMVAQDTGGAIRGPVRGDVYWGYGERAEILAGAMKAKGRYWILLPKNIRPASA